jgi:PPP family 3-phenylpropionic acid transporter
LALLVLAQLLHAATFGSTHVATIHLIHEYFGKQHQGKGQGLYGSLCGLGSVLGGIVGGYCWETVGATIIFSVGGLVCTLAWLITYLWLGKTHKVRKIIVK